eukprot:Hpha_TRINITY_DN924_c0_g1::TRINITY_DN924_c0_g1_i1::g.156251::m.156251
MSGDDRRRRRRREAHLIPIKGSQIINKTYGYASCVLTFVAFIVFTMGVIMPLGYFSMRSGLRYSAGALLPGRNIRSGSFDALRVCYGVAEADENVIGFMWYTNTASPQAGRVECEFKGEGTSWVGTQPGQTAVVKMTSSWGCGILSCTGLRETNMVDMYDCDTLGSVLVAAQALAMVAMACSGFTLFLQSSFLWGWFVKRLVFLSKYLQLFHMITAASGGVSMVLLVVGFMAEFCGRTLSRDAVQGLTPTLMAVGTIFIVPPILLVKKGLGPLRKEDPRGEQPKDTGDLVDLPMVPQPQQSAPGISPFGNPHDEDDLSAVDVDEVHQLVTPRENAIPEAPLN